MAAKESRAAAERALLDGFDVYDRAVDVVSVFEWLHTDPRVDAAGPVLHFERYPSIPAPDGKQATPDFTILFADGTAVAGEVARLALRKESVDKLCAQLGRYDSLTAVPDARGRLQPADVDVMYLVEMRLGMAAVQRVLKERLADPGHPYSPVRPPVVVQYAREADRYIFQRIPAPENGALRDSGRSRRSGRSCPPTASRSRPIASPPSRPPAPSPTTRRTRSTSRHTSGRRRCRAPTARRPATR